MKNKILLFGAAALTVLFISARAADIYGNWIAKIWSGQGPGETVFSFRVDGTELTGTVSDPQGKADIIDGKIDGDEISFCVIRNQDGNEIKLTYRGRVGVSEIRFTLEEEGRTGGPVEFVAKREFQRDQDVPLRPVRVERPPQ